VDSSSNELATNLSRFSGWTVAQVETLDADVSGREEAHASGKGRPSIPTLDHDEAGARSIDRERQGDGLRVRPSGMGDRCRRRLDCWD
jgi:hypothetical protein